ncbi:MAG: TraB/GumN family protein [Myxococcota bacterium]|nr:TraB/GumN family protein [Myxococcota bacterium]
MKRGLALVVMMVSLVGTSCRKTERSPEKVPAPPPAKVEGSGSSGSAAAAPDPWKQEASKKDPLKAIFFWTIEKDGKATYLLGTMHMGIEPETRLPQIVWDKLDAAKTFAMEADLSDPKLGATMIRTSGSLEDDLGKEYWAKLEKALGPQMAAQMSQMTPMGAAAMMALKDLPKTAPMDGVLLGRAINQKKAIVYLEEGALQAQILAKHMGVKALKMMIDNYEKGAAQTKAMLDAYSAGDPDAILKITDDQKVDSMKHGFTKAEYDEQMEDILYKRNASWIEAIEKMHTEGNAFVAVGALHLIGPRSVLEMLEKKGYKVTRLTP